MHEKKGKMIVVGTVSGGGWDCTDQYEGIPNPWGKDFDIMDQRWNKVSAHVDWISKIIKGTKAEQCDTAVSPGP